MPRAGAPRLIRHAPAVAGDHTAVFVLGYWSKGKVEAAHVQEYIDGLRAAGFRGAIDQYWWDAGSLADVLVPVLLKLGARVAALIAARRAGAALPRRAAWAPAELLDFLHDWRAAHARAEAVGRAMPRALARAYGSRPVTLIGHSLGARVAHYALLEAPAASLQFQDALLLGGAHPCKDPAWKDTLAAVRGRIYNLHCARDPILRYAYRAGQLATHKPCGLAPIRPVMRGLRNLDAAPALAHYRNPHDHYIDHLAEILGTRRCRDVFGRPRPPA